MKLEVVRIPSSAGEAYIDIAKWMRADLIKRGANTQEWNGRIWYLFPGDLANLRTSEAMLSITSNGCTHLSIRPESGGSEESLCRGELEPAEHWNDTHALLRRMIMREAKDAHNTVLHHVTRMAEES